MVDHFLLMLGGWHFQDMQIGIWTVNPETVSLLTLVKSGLPTPYILVEVKNMLNFRIWLKTMYWVGRPLSINVRRLKFSGYADRYLNCKSWKYQPPNISRKWSRRLLMGLSEPNWRHNGAKWRQHGAKMSPLWHHVAPFWCYYENFIKYYKNGIMGLSEPNWCHYRTKMAPFGNTAKI